MNRSETDFVGAAPSCRDPNPPWKHGRQQTSSPGPAHSRQAGTRQLRPARLDSMNRIDRIQDTPDIRANDSPLGGSPWLGNLSCSSCKSCLKCLVSRFSAMTRAQAIAQNKERPPLTQAKTRRKTQRPAAESKAENTTLRRKTQFPSSMFHRKNRAAHAVETSVLDQTWAWSCHES